MSQHICWKDQTCLNTPQGHLHNKSGVHIWAFSSCSLVCFTVSFQFYNLNFHSFSVFLPSIADPLTLFFFFKRVFVVVSPLYSHENIRISQFLQKKKKTCCLFIYLFFWRWGDCLNLQIRFWGNDIFIILFLISIMISSLNFQTYKYFLVISLSVFFQRNTLNYLNCSKFIETRLMIQHMVNFYEFSLCAWKKKNIYIYIT